MADLVIRGGRQLAGRVHVEGNKNAALPLLAACLLTDQPCEIRNVPRIRDVGVMVRLMRSLGAEVGGEGTPTIRVRCANISSAEPDPQLVGRLRGSVLLLGPLLGRTGKARLAPPGGDFPARRTITTHLQALMALGATVTSDAGHRRRRRLTGTSVYLYSVGDRHRNRASPRRPPKASEFAMPRAAARHRAVRHAGRHGRRSLRRRHIDVAHMPPAHLSSHSQLRGDPWTAAGRAGAITNGTVESPARQPSTWSPSHRSSADGPDFDLPTDDLPSTVGAPRRRVTTGLWPGFPSDIDSP